MDGTPVEHDRLLSLTANIVSAHVSRNQVTVSDVASLVREVFEALSKLKAAEQIPEEPKKAPSVSIRASVKPDYLVCLACGSRQKTLKRHLNSAHGLSPRDYRAEFNLPADYPMVAATYSKRRSEMAQALGLGRKAEFAPQARKKKP